MNKSFSTQNNSDSATPDLQSNNGATTADSDFQDRVTNSETKFSDLPFRATKDDLEQSSKSSETPHPQRPGLRLRARVTAIAIAVGMLPVLAVGTATYYFGVKAITDQAAQSRRAGTIGLEEAELTQQTELQWLAALLVGTGATALLSGALAALWINRSLRSAMVTAAVKTAQEAAEDRVVRTKLFTDAVYQIRASLKEEDILKAAVEEARKAIAADRVVVYSLDENSRGIVIAESVVKGWPRALPRALGTMVRDHYFEEVYLEKYQNGRVQVIDDIYEAKLTPCHQEILESFAVRANLVAPLLNEKKLIGLLVAHQCSGPRVWQQSDIDLFTQIATQVSFALENAKLLDERASLQEQLDIETKWKEFFADATRIIHSSLSEEDILKAAVEEGRRVLAADRVLVYGLERESLGVVIAESVAPGWPKALGATIEDPCFEARYIEKYENGRVWALNNIYEAGMTPCYIDTLETLAVKANLVTPILYEGKLLGLLIAHQCSKPRVWKPVEIRWFTQIAEQVGFALDNAKLIRRVEQMTQNAETGAGERCQEEAALRQQLSALLSDSEAAIDAFSTEASEQTLALTSAIAQIQGIADVARSMTANAQKAELQLQQLSQGVQAGHQTVNRTVDSIADLQENLVDATIKSKHLVQTAQKLSQFVDLSKDLAAQMNRQVINATIEAGRNGDAFQHSVVFIAEVVRSFTQQLTKATAEIDPLVAEFETEAYTLAAAMENGKEEMVAGTELTKETRLHLNQLAITSAKLNTLINNIASAAADQARTSTCASQTVLEVANLANHTSEQSAAAIKSFTKLKAIAQIPNFTQLPSQLSVENNFSNRPT